jgi:CIC family chloride channel protein
MFAAGVAGVKRWLRSNAFAHVGVGVIAGALAGAAVTAMSFVAEAMHVAIFGIAFDQRLSAKAVVSSPVAFASLMLGGLAMGLFEFWRRRRKLGGIVDPIEANALRGGRLSLRDGLVVVAQTLISNGSGASVGLEAGYAQIGSALASRLGVAVRLRRQDLRMMVGCGAAGAIAAAFAAPLTGAFYAFELIIGVYSLANAAPVIAAAVAGALVVRALGGAPYLVHAPQVAALGVEAHFALVGLGLVSAALGVGAMRAAALIERGFQASPLPQWARPVAGGVIVACFAIYTPQVLGAGHGALDLDIPRSLSAATLATLIIVKLAACLVSLASGFRGGLFFASLFVGALLGKLYALGIAAILPNLALDPTACMFAGMATLGVAIVGGPLTMAFLVLESSGDLAVVGGVLAACIATSLTVRMTFGYSFSTWRLHLRGQTIRSAQDVGWRRELTVARLMDRDPAIGHAGETVAEFRTSHPLGSARHVVLEDGAGRYAGLVAVPEAYADEQPDEHPVSDLARLAEVTLSPEMEAKEALALFETAQSDILAVVDPESGALLGTLGEAFTARRYAEALALAARGVLDQG